MTVPDAIVCPSCGKRYAYKPALAGKRVKCKCGGAIDVPLPNDPADDPPALDDIDFAHVPETTALPPAAPAPVHARANSGPAPKPAAAAAEESKKDDWSWWRSVATGVAMIAVGVFEYGRLTKLDSGEVQKVRVARWEAAVYSTLGSTGFLVIALAAGLFCAGFGVYQVLEQRKRSHSAA